MKRVRIFWDLDETLLDTPALLRPILEDLGEAVGRAPEDVRRAISELDKLGFTWERLFVAIGLPLGRFAEKSAMCAAQYARAEAYLFPGAREAVAGLAPIAEQILVTFGDQAFQRRKWSAIPSLHSFFHAAHFVDGETIGKGPLIASYDPSGVASVFVDDSPRWQTDCALHAPHVERVAFRYTPGAYRDILTLARRLAG